jgi:ketosteroid isomerase-like protein
MTRENVEIIRGGFESWNAGDPEAIRAGLDPRVILRPPTDWPEPGPFVGPDAVMRQWEQIRETFDADSLELVSDFVDAGDRVAVRAVWRGAGRGPQSSIEMTYVFTVRNGLVLAIEEFWDHGEALATMGLPEQARADA